MRYKRSEQTLHQNDLRSGDPIGYKMKTLLLFLATSIVLLFGFRFGGFIHCKHRAIAGKLEAFNIKVDGKVVEIDTSKANLRKELMKKNIDVYPLKAKITGNCGGAGICGTCAVKVLDGSENLSPPSANEQKVLKENGRDSGIRLSCCAKVSGPISIKTKP